MRTTPEIGRALNVMLTCAGRRNYLVRFFQEALGNRGQVFAADVAGDAPALRQADLAFSTPPFTDAGYVDTLVELCRRHRVLLLISLHDLELPLLARNSARFREVGTIPVVSSPDVVETCFDKWQTSSFLAGCGLEAPRTWLSLADACAALARGETSFPLVIKPRWGTASVGIDSANDLEELELSLALAKKRVRRTILRDVHASEHDACILIQKHVCGEEYGIDVVNDLDGRYACTFVRKKLAMRAGETDRAVTVRSERLEALGETIGRRLGHVGILDCDVIVNEDGCYVLDLNPRFGGGYPFSHVAGADVPAMYLAWATREQCQPHWVEVEPDVVSSKYDQLIVVERRAALKAVGDVQGSSR